MNFQRLTWVLQENAFSERDFTELSAAIRSFGCALEFIKITPFSHEVIGSTPEIEGPCVVYGSGGLMDTARHHGWIPAGWDGPSFDQSRVVQALGKLALNDEFDVVPYRGAHRAALNHGWETVFVRPNAETKEFAGRVFKLDELHSWIDRLKSADYFAQGDNLAFTAPAKPIGREWRAFVVDGEVLTVSQYAEAGEPATSGILPQSVVDTLRSSILVYRPAPCFVVDVAEVIHADGTRIQVVEYNSINSSGFYDCDIHTIVEALSTFVLSCKN